MSDLPSGLSSNQPRIRSGRARHVLLAVVIFLGGAACGAAIATVIVIHMIHHTINEPDKAIAHFTSHLTSRLDLADSQSDQVRQIVARKQEALSTIRNDIQPRLEMELSALEEEIAGVLNDAQRNEWREMAKKFRRHWLPPASAQRSPH